MTTYYHASRHPNWFEKVVSAASMVHVGTIEAALDRACDIRNDHRGKIYLYEINLDPDTLLEEGIRQDDFSAQGHPFPNDGYDGYRYENEAEGEGSISLFIDPICFQSVSLVGETFDTVKNEVEWDYLPFTAYDNESVEIPA